MKLISTALLAGTVSAQTAGDYAALSARLQGDLFLPGDAGFAESSKLKNPRLEDDGQRQPAAVVVAQSTADVQEAVNFAAAFDELAFSVKSTGHCYNGNCLAKDSLHLDLSEMNEVQIEESANGEITARAGPGVVFHQIYEACEEYGAVVAVGGMGSSVGMVGFSSGGGHGPLVRRFGLGADQLVSTTVVLADGSVVVADAENHSDLFWAIRGGGGGTWGVQVENQIRVHRAQNVYSLSCFYPMASGRGADAVDVGTPVLAAFLGTDLTRELPAEWGVYAMGTKIPFQPEALAGYDFVNMDGSVQFEGVYVGNGTLAEATASAAPLMNLMPEYQTSCVVREEESFLKWHTSKAATMDPSGDTLRGYMESAFINVDTLGGGGDGAIAAGEELAGIVVNTTLELGATSFAAWFGVHLGGVIKSKDADDTAVSTAFRQADLVLEATASWIRAGADAAEVGWAKDCSERVQAVEGVGSEQYLNEADPDAEDFAHMFWDESQYTRLQAVKAEVDPENVFACWQCVEPTK